MQEGARAHSCVKSTTCAKVASAGMSFVPDIVMLCLASSKVSTVGNPALQIRPASGCICAVSS